MRNDTLQKFQCLSTCMKSQEKRHNVLQRDEKIYWHIESNSNNDCLSSFYIFENNSDKQINKIENIILSTKIHRIQKQANKQKKTG